MYIASSSKWIISALSGAAAIVALPVLAAGFGEPRPIKFETPSERQVLHYAERDRQSLNAAKKKVDAVPVAVDLVKLMLSDQLKEQKRPLITLKLLRILT